MHLCKMQVDYIIVGQGICGSFLSHALIKAGKSVLVVDENRPFSSSKVASGVINPITGRRMVRTWEIETLMPFAVHAYHMLGEELGAPLIKQTNILDFHPTPQMVLAFAERQPIESDYLQIPTNTDQWKKYFRFDFSIGEINPCWLIDLHTFLQKWRSTLQAKNALLETVFNLQECDITNEKVRYREITAQKIIFCDGVAGMSNPYFHLLPYARNKGEALIVHVPGLPQQNIYKQGYVMVPWKENQFWVGSSYEWTFENDTPTEAFRTKVENHLKHFLKIPFEIIDHFAAERPANMERRPFVGLHPISTSVGIFNGMGTKGCSLAPYFAEQFAAYLVNGTPLHPNADVRRFSKILSR